MPYEDSQSPDDMELERLITQCIQIVPGLACRACLHYKYSPSQDEVDELSQQIFVLLIDDDYRVLRSFEHRSSLKTWLFPVVTHHVGYYLRRRKKEISLEEVSPDLFTSQPTQEEQIAFDENLESLSAILSNLAKPERELFELMCRGLDAAEIAKLMGTTTGAIYQRKRRLKKKIQRFLEE